MRFIWSPVGITFRRESASEEGSPKTWLKVKHHFVHRHSCLSPDRWNNEDQQLPRPMLLMCFVLFLLTPLVSEITYCAFNLKRLQWTESSPLILSTSTFTEVYLKCLLFIITPNCTFVIERRRGSLFYISKESNKPECIFPICCPSICNPNTGAWKVCLQWSSKYIIGA